MHLVPKEVRSPPPHPQEGEPVGQELHLGKCPCVTELREELHRQTINSYNPKLKGHV